MSEGKFYRTTFQVVVLSEEPIGPDESLKDVLRECVDGDYSGESSVAKVEEIDGKEMAKALIEQRSDPSFFGLNEDGSPCDYLGEDDDE